MSRQQNGCFLFVVAVASLLACCRLLFDSALSLSLTCTPPHSPRPERKSVEGCGARVVCTTQSQEVSVEGDFAKQPLRCQGWARAFVFAFSWVFSCSSLCLSFFLSFPVLLVVCLILVLVDGLVFAGLKSCRRLFVCWDCGTRLCGTDVFVKKALSSEIRVLGRQHRLFACWFACLLNERTARLPDCPADSGTAYAFPFVPAVPPCPPLCSTQRQRRRPHLPLLQTFHQW